MKIGLDIDGTIALTHEKVIRVLKNEGKIDKKIKNKDIKWLRIEWNPEKQTGFEGLQQQDLHDVFMRRDFWDDISIYRGIKDILKYISIENDFYACTDRRWYPELKDQTAKWLDKRNIRYKRLDCIKGIEKGDYAKENNLDIFIEDNIDNAIAIAPFVETVYLIEQPWNDVSQSFLPENVIRCDWEKIGKDFRTTYYYKSHDNYSNGWADERDREL